MGMRIQNNIESMNTQRQLSKSSAAVSKSLERLSSGLRINKASDDAAGLSISQSMRADIASSTVASRNISEATSMAQVAEGAYDQIGNILTRLKELATQASSANVGSSDKTKINSEATALTSEITRISNATEYSDTALLSAASTQTFQVGAENTTDNRIEINFTAVTLGALGLGSLDLSSAASAQAALDSIDTAVGSLNTARGNLGAVQNRLAYAGANLSTTIENVQSAESVIRDVDMASEMTTFTKNQILMQAGTAMLAQANQAPQQVLSLLQ